MTEARLREIRTSRLVLVEGLDYYYFLLKSPLAREGIFPDRVQLFDFKQNGLELADFVDLLRAARGFSKVSHLGVIRDAEFNHSAMRASVKDGLRRNGFTVPDAPGELGLGMPKVAYWLMPGEGLDGCFEHACLGACKKPEIVACAEAFLRCSGNHAKNQNHQAKVKVHTAIVGASDNPALTLGQSAETDLWDFNHPQLRGMLEFIRRVATDAAE